MKAQVELVQPGWLVFASDGEEVGKVASLDEDMLVVKKSGLLGEKAFHLPRMTVAEVEEGRVELNVSKDDVNRLFG